MSRLRVPTALVAALLVFSACGTPKGTGVQETFDPQAEIPELEGVAEGGADEGASEGLGEAPVDVSEAAPPGLRIARFTISPITPALRDAINFTGFQSGGTSGLIELPVFGLNDRQKIYYLVVPVINEGDAPVRNLKARADFFDSQGRQVWSETLALTHLPTRLALNPPSLPNEDEPQPPLGPDVSGYGLYYFPTNAGLFVFSVPDPTIAQTVRSWRLTYLVSTS
ncbi:MAG: hypothetical protein WD770_10450 [Actinomycetota bacterium]